MGKSWIDFRTNEDDPCTIWSGQAIVTGIDGLELPPGSLSGNTFIKSSCLPLARVSRPSSSNRTWVPFKSNTAVYHNVRVESDYEVIESDVSIHSDM